MVFGMTFKNSDASYIAGLASSQSNNRNSQPTACSYRTLFSPQFFQKAAVKEIVDNSAFYFWIVDELVNERLNSFAARIGRHREQVLMKIITRFERVLILHAREFLYHFNAFFLPGPVENNRILNRSKK